MSHKFAVKVLRSGWAPRDVCEDNKRLRATVRQPFTLLPSTQPEIATQLWGDELSNPLGVAAGFDKNGEAVDGECIHAALSDKIGEMRPQLTTFIDKVDPLMWRFLSK